MARSANATTSLPASFYWYDLETSGTHPSSDRIVQFAGRRTDARLQPVGEPYVAFVRLAPDVLPTPEACLVTGITPQRANAEGIDEWQALREVEALFRESGTCIAGYNNLRFDDEFVRYGFYRNLMDPYAWAWRDGNSRWDLIDLTRAAAALRPDGICWPMEDGVPSFRLDRLSVANGIAHDDAHDARADLEATIGLARLLRGAQPKLWRFALSQRFRHSAAALLLPLGARLCVHVSNRYPNKRYCTAPVASVAEHPEIPNRVIVADLSRDISALIDCDATEIAERLFATDLESGEERPPLKAVVTNRCPFVAPIEVVREADAERLGFDRASIERRRRELAAMPELADKIQEVYRRSAWPSLSEDAEFALYDDFIDDADRPAIQRLQQALATGAPWPAFAPGDDRLRILGARLKARLRTPELDAAERAAWDGHIRRCLDDGFGRRPSLARYRSEIAELLACETAADRRRILEDLAAYEPTW